MTLRKTDEETNLTPNQEQAIIALLHDPGLTSAAEAAGVGKSTLWRWMKEPTFKAEYRRARREAVSQAVARLQQVSSEAAESLREVATDPAAPHAARVSASRAILVMAFTGMESEDLAARIEALEGRSEDE